MVDDEPERARSGARASARPAAEPTSAPAAEPTSGDAAEPASTEAAEPAPGDRPRGLKPSVDELGEASFPASDPPQAWTWEVPGRRGR